MRRYEQVFILRPTLSEDQISKIIENTSQLVEKDSGSIIYLNKWGMRKLAYPIKKEAQGYYVLCDFAASPGIVAEIERKFRIDDSVLKYLTVKIADEISSAEIEAAKTEAEEKAIGPEPEESAEPATEDKPAKPPAPKADKSAAAPAPEAEGAQEVENKDEAGSEPSEESAH